MSYASGFTKDMSVMEDAIHDVFVYIWNKREQLSTVDKIRPYLLVSLRHSILKKLKKQKNLELKDADESFTEYDASAEENLIQEEFRIEMSGKLKVAFKQLSNRQREAIFLRYLENMEYEEICELMSINYQSVRNLISSGIKKLALFLKEKNIE